MKLDLADVNIRVIDQRIGMGVGGFDTVIRVLHVPTGIIIEMPRLTRSQWHDRQAALDALEMALADVSDHAGRAALRERE
ncbi:MAG: hypothetical protein NBV76_05460 [Candidatus Ochrobactrum gambitense]|nr:MAG: hypothetical protein NBV76_05460 [Candidatus Ochrobactrum gambitense]WEK17180.1 MAG: hypothetical protein P0Y54_05500 [Candidatus Ochrobactrum gambitense]